jgi:uncharacterized membrane protein
MERPSRLTGLIKLTLILLLTSFFLIASATAATIHGRVYLWETLEPVNAIVEINTTPLQKMVTENGSYSFEVPPGVYKLKAYLIGSDLYAEENVTIVTEGSYVMDLVLFPSIEYPQFEEISKVEFLVEDGGQNNFFYLIPLLLAVGIALLTFWIFRRKKVEEIEFEDEKAPGLPDDLKEIVEVLVKEGGRISQRELRRKLGYSEAKISLMVADLERRGIVEKVKKGRGNLIFLRDEFIK